MTLADATENRPRYPAPPSAARLNRPLILRSPLAHTHTRKHIPKKTLSDPLGSDYDPEIVVLARCPPPSALSEGARSTLRPALCHRLIDVEPIPQEGGGTGGGEDAGVRDGGRDLTKLRALDLDDYGVILYVDAGCLILGDVRSLFRLGGERTRGGAPELLGAAASFPAASAGDGDGRRRFDSSAFLFRPCGSTIDGVLSTGRGRGGAVNGREDVGEYDAAGTLLGSIFPDAAVRKLPFSRDPSTPAKIMWCGRVWADAARGEVVDDGRGAEEAMTPADGMRKRWRNWHRRSEAYVVKFQKRAEEDEKRRREEEGGRIRKRKETEAVSGGGGGENPKKSGGTASATPVTKDMDIHKKVTIRFRELRKVGMSAVDAMSKAREEIGADKNDGTTAGDKVAAMFGMGG